MVCLSYICRQWTDDRHHQHQHPSNPCIDFPFLNLYLTLFCFSVRFQYTVPFLDNVLNPIRSDRTRRVLVCTSIL